MRRFAHALWLTAALVLLGGRMAGADVAPLPDPGETLGVDDVIQVLVRNHSELNQIVTISSQGNIVMQDAGEVKAVGKTATKLAADIQEELEKTLNNVSVSVVVKERHSRHVRVIGSGLHLNGIFELKPNTKVFDLVVAAGGVNGKPAWTKARIIRAKSEIPLDLDTVVEQPESKANLFLEPDDLVIVDQVAPARHQIHVLGQVAKAGAVELDDNLTVLNLFSTIGGPGPRAALTHAYVLRGSKEIPLNLHPLLVEGKSDPAISSFKFEPGDILFVPENQKHISVMGAVAQQGFLPFPETGKLTVLQAYTAVGGTGGDASRAQVVRQVDGKPSITQVNIEEIIRKGKMASNMELQPDDILYVPARGKRGIGIQDVLAPLSVLSFLGLRF